MLYRTVSEEVPSGEYTIPLGEARITRTGSDITLVGWGQQVAVLERAVSCPSILCPPAEIPMSVFDTALGTFVQSGLQEWII